MTLKVKILHLISSVPSLILSLVALEHLMKEIQGDHFWRKVMHPWFMFASCMAFFLFCFNLFVFGVIYFQWYDHFPNWRVFRQFPRNEHSYKKIEWFLILVDCMWSVLWMLQICVQLLLPETHRIIHKKSLHHMLILYLIHFTASIPLAVAIYQSWKCTQKSIKRTTTVKNIHGPRSIRRLVVQ